MYRLWFLSMFLAAPITSVAAGPALVELTDRLGDTAGAEAEGALKLIAAVRAAVGAGAVTLDAEATAQLERAQQAWEEARRLAAGREFGPAFKLERKEARPALRGAVRGMLGGTVPPEVGEAVTAYLESTRDRLAAIDAQIVNYPLTLDAQESHLIGKARWEAAAKSAKKKKWDEAFRLLFDSLTELDKAMLECYPTSR
jgi:hypothetical protein